jgi:hypothetical protein
MTKKKILSSWEETWDTHRGDFETCPACGHKETIKTWATLAIILVKKPKFFRSGSVVVVNECNQCFEKSWTHESTGSFEYSERYPENWKKVVKEIDEALKLQALRDWGAGICHKCKHLKSGTVYYHAWRHCKIGTGPAETRCSVFEECNK